MFSFKLPDAFVADYANRPVPWGYTDAAGNSVGEITFLRTYSRLKDDGTKETWVDVCRRVIEGMFSIQRDHAKANRLPWSQAKARRTAEDAFDRLFHFKWTPPGRGLWMMGTPLVMEQRNSAALQNCAFVSTADMTRDDPAAPFAFLMEASMLGIGVGFDTKGAAKGFQVYNASVADIDEHRERDPEFTDEYVAAHTYVIPDSREGWVKSVIRLLNSYLVAGAPVVFFDYSLIRPAGEPIRTFGGTAAGPEPLKRLHDSLRTVLDARAGSTLTTTDLLDIGNLIGVCVVSGNVRRSAELALGSIDDADFLMAKDFSQFREVDQTYYEQVWRDRTTGEIVEQEAGPVDQGHGDNRPANADLVTEERTRKVWETTYAGSRDDRASWGWMSNNSVEVNVGDDLSRVIEGIQRNGEPGIVWMDLSRSHGRLADEPTHADHRAAGYNPCAEQTLESFECCTLVETYLGRHDTLEDYKRTLKVAYLYAKTVTLLPTHWPRTNAIMQRNRRIGTSAAGAANFVDRHGYNVLRQWWDKGYPSVEHWDRTYSEWLGIRESIKMTTIKPGGTTPLLAGDSPGVHWTPGGEFFERRIRFSKADPMLTLFRWAGYKVADAPEDPATTSTVAFPIHSTARRSEKDVSIFEKVALAALAQRYWSDNSVSVTISYDPDTEAQHIPTVLSMYEGKLKTVSFLPMAEGTYQEMPYTGITAEDYAAAELSLLPVDLSGIYAGQALDAAGEAFCTTDACEVKAVTA